VFWTAVGERHREEVLRPLWAPPISFSLGP
jgi:hypothetical protein